MFRIILFCLLLYVLFIVIFLRISAREFVFLSSHIPTYILCIIICISTNKGKPLKNSISRLDTIMLMLLHCVELCMCQISDHGNIEYLDVIFDKILLIYSDFQELLIYIVKYKITNKGHELNN